MHLSDLNKNLHLMRARSTERQKYNAAILGHCFLISTPSILTKLIFKLEKCVWCLLGTLLELLTNYSKEKKAHSVALSTWLHTFALSFTSCVALEHCSSLKRELIQPLGR